MSAPEYNPERRRLVGAATLTPLLLLGGVLSVIAGVECSNRRLGEARDLENQMISIYLQSEDPKKAMQTVEELKKEVSRRNFIRDRLEVWPIFGGGALVFIGVLRLLKFM